MRAVVMAGGEGTRLRPMTANQPKPLLPVVNRPIMEHVLRLLKRHGFDETIVTVQFLAALVRNYFGDGEELGMHLTYATEETPLGTAGSVKNAEEALAGEPFLVISGDALTDIDLTDLVRFHKEKGAMVTVALVKVPNPLEFGIVITDDEGRIERFLEKPTWGQVFSDQVNTGIYVMQPEVLDRVAAGENVDWSSDVFPELLKEGEKVYGYVAEGYWEDVGTHESYLSAQADVLNRQVDVEISGFEVSHGVWIGEGAEVDPEAIIKGPVVIGPYAKVEAGAELREFTVLGSNVVVKSGAFLHRAIVHDNVFIGPGTNLRGCVIGKNTDIMRGARVEEGVVVGDECVIEAEAYLSHGVKVYPFKTIEAGAVVNTSVIWESRGQRALFGPRGVSGMVNVEVTPEHAVRLASAFATGLTKGSVVTTARDASRSARALKRAVISALTASAINVRDLEVTPAPVARFDVATSGSSGGVILRTTPGDPQSIDIMFLDASGADLSQAAQRKLERVFSRQEFRRAFPGEIAELTFPARTIEGYASEVLRVVDTSGVAEAGMKVVLDTAGGSASLVLPALLGKIGVDVLTVNGRLDEQRTTEDARRQDARHGAPGRLGLQQPGRFRGAVRRGGGADQPGGRDGGGHRGRARAPRPARPGRGRAPRRPDRAAGDDDPRRGERHPLPRHVDPVDADRHGRLGARRWSARRHLRRRRSRRVRGARGGAARRRSRGLRAPRRAGGQDAPDALPDRRAHPRGLRGAAGPSRRPGRSRERSCGPWWRRRGTGRSTPRTGSGSSRRTAPGRWCCPTPSDAATHIWAEAADAASAAALLARWAEVVERTGS